MLIALLLNVATINAAAWDTTGIDGLAAYTSIALDSDGYPHISYSRRNLMYAHHDGASWSVDIVELTTDLRATSIALDSNNHPHIGYVVSPTNQVKYAYYDGSAWDIQIIETPPDFCNYVSIAVDSSDNPHVSYSHGSFPSGKLKYAYNDGSSWNIETVDSTGSVEGLGSLALDSSNLPHISYYYGYPYYDLVYAHHTGSSWSIDTVESAGSVGQRSSIAIDSSDHPHICYLGDTDLKYAYNAGSGWNIETVDSTDIDGSVSIALDTSDLPHISYEDYTNMDLKYAHYTGSAWSIEVIDSADAGPHSSIAVDSSGYPHISYIGDYSVGRQLRYSYMLHSAIEVTPQHGSVGSAIYVQGSDFAPSEQVDLYIDSNFLKTFTTDSSGSLAGTFTVPAMSDGVYTLLAQGQTSSAEASAQFKVGLMLVILSPDHGPVDTPVTITGNGFEVGGAWTAYLGPELVANGIVAPEGTVTGSFTVPIMGAGAYTFKVVDEATGIEVSTTFNVGNAATIEVSPPYGPQGTSIYIEGFDFAPNQVVDLYLQDLSGAPTYLLDSVTTTSGGGFARSVLVPAISTGLYNLIARQTSSGLGASRPFMVDMTQVLCSPDTGRAGSTITFSGAGFVHDGAWIATLGGVPVVSGIAESDGTIDGMFIVPNLDAGTHQLVFEDIVGPRACDFEVLPSVIWDTFPLSGPTGSDVAVRGYGFTPSGEWDATMETVDLFQNTTYADASGDVLGIFKVPLLSPGTYPLNVVDVGAGPHPQYRASGEVTEYDASYYPDPSSSSVVDGQWSLDVTGEVVDFKLFYFEVNLISEPEGGVPVGSVDFFNITFHSPDLLGNPPFAIDDEGAWIVTGNFRIDKLAVQPDGSKVWIYNFLSPQGGAVHIYPGGGMALDVGPWHLKGTINPMQLQSFVVTGIGVPEGVVSWWPGDGNTYDIIGVNHGAQVNGGNYSTGLVDEAFVFDGVDDFMRAPGEGIDDAQQLSLEAWVYLNTLPDRTMRFVTLSPPGLERACIRYNYESGHRELHFFMRIGDETTPFTHLNVEDVLLQATWHHVVGTYDGSYMRLYLDGVEVANTAISGPVALGTDWGVRLSSPDEPLDGLLDEVCVYSRALTADEVRLIYEAGSNGKCGPRSQFVTFASYSDPVSRTVIPVGEIIPIQSAMKPSLLPDGTIDLVIGKPTAIMVNLGEEAAQGFTLSFNGAPVQATLVGNNLYVLENFPTANQPPGSISTFECMYTSATGTHQLTRKVRFVATSDMDLTITKVSRYKSGKPIDYGFVEADDYETMSAGVKSTIDSAYPAQLNAFIDSVGVTGASSGRNYKGILADIAVALQKAQLNANPPGSALAVVVGPNMIDRSTQYPTITKDYFMYHGLPGVAGISFGPGYPSVVSLDGYYWGPAHEIGHVYDLFWGEPEQYMLVSGAPGYAASGAWVNEASVIDAYDFMGIGAYENTRSNWVCTSTYVELLKKLKTIPSDPEIILVNGLIHNGTVEQLLPWYSISAGVPDVITPGDYSLRFIDQNGATLLDISFTADFFMHIDPGRNVLAGTEGFGMVPIDVAPFAFAAEYPTGTTTIQVVNNTDTENPEIIYEVSASEVQEHPVANAGGPYTAVDGEPVIFDGSSSLGDNLQYRWDFQADGVWDTEWSTCPTTTCVWDDEWGGTVLLEVTNGELFQIETIQVTTQNTPPAMSPMEISLDPFQVNTPVTACAAYSDEAQDTHVAEWDWGDGTAPTTVCLGAGVCVTECTHTYTSTGVFTLTLTLTDNHGQASTTEHKYVVVYDPTGGFVTGGGWITSPVGAYTPDPTLAGKATFGFVSKYVKGSNVPVGNTEFVFHTAGFKFVSTSYDWLVIAGSSAKFKGTGTVNGQGSYGFMLTATDGDPKGDADAFRIKVWDKASETVVYDNKINAPDDSYDGTALSGGNIVVHKAK